MTISINTTTIKDEMIRRLRELATDESYSGNDKLTFRCAAHSLESTKASATSVAGVAL